MNPHSMEDQAAKVFEYQMKQDAHCDDLRRAICKIANHLGLELDICEGDRDPGGGGPPPWPPE